MKSSRPITGQPISLSIVLPCHNEAHAIVAVLQRLADTLSNLQRQGQISSSQIVVVDDASTDSSRALLGQFPQVQVWTLARRSGYGAALKAGFRLCHGDAVVFLDMDDTYDARDLPQFLTALDNTDMVMGERFSRGQGMPLARRLGNHLFSALIRVLYGRPLRDACTGFRMMRRSLLPQVCSLPENGLNFCLALTIWSLREELACVEVPIAYHLRKGSSKLSVSADGCRFLWTILTKRFFMDRRSSFGA
jgi:glycosyltransferase involved in cell wall biosynthesis